MIIKSIQAVSLTALLTFAGCQSEEIMQKNDQTAFIVSLTDELSVTTKGTPGDLTKPENIILSLTKGEDASKEVSFTNGVTKTITIDAGTYSVYAYAGENKFGFDSPYYRGVPTDGEVQELKAGEQKSLSIVCKVANAMASVSYTNGNAVETAFGTNYSIVVTIDPETENSKTIIWAQSGDDKGMNPYFPAGSKVTFAFRGTYNNEERTQEIATIEKAEAGKNYVLNITFKQVASIGIDIDTDVSEETITQNIPMTWLPKPTVSGVGFDENNTLTFTETQTNMPSASIKLDMALTLQELKMKFNFEDKDALPSTIENNKYYKLSEDEEILESIGIDLPSIGSVSPSIGLNNLISNIKTYNGQSTTNYISIIISSNNKDSEEQIFTITCEKPIFSVSVYPGNIWTKEFTINSLSEDQVETGSYKTISEDLTYQFSTDADNWSTMSALRKSELSPNTKYYVRPLYRGKVPGEITEVTTYPTTELENGGLETYTKEGNDGKIFENYGARYYWDNWATLNELTCDYCLATAYAYNTRSGTRPITGSDAYNGTSVWIATIGWGYGGTTSSSNNQTPGELFLGSLTDVDHSSDTATKNYGIEYASKPTSVKFMYKYIPYNGDRSDIYIQVLHDNEVLGGAELQETENISKYNQAELKINYDDDKIQLEPNRLILVFKSGFNSSVKNYGSSGLNGVRMVGSQLFIDDVTLIYDK